MESRGLPFTMRRDAVHRYFQESFGFVRQKMRQSCRISSRNAGGDPVGPRASRSDERQGATQAVAVMANVQFDHLQRTQQTVSLGVPRETALLVHLFQPPALQHGDS